MVVESLLQTELIIEGPTNGNLGIPYDYSFYLIDPEGCDLWLIIDWDDQTPSEWLGPFDPFKKVILSHTWDECGNFTIQAVARECNDSLYYATLNVTITFHNILYVGGSGSNNYTSIQNAINNATEGDTVFVYDDLSPYYENFSINKSINLQGEDKNTTIIDGKGDDIVLIEANDTTISGFTIQNGRFAIRALSSSGLLISENIIKNNGLEGIYLSNSSYNTISNNIVKDNYYGIGLHWAVSGPGPCKYNNILNNKVLNNAQRGIHMSFYHEYNKIIGNTIAYNKKYGIKICCRCNNNIIYHNNFKANIQNAKDEYTNVWDNSYPSGGNYWDDYNGTDADDDGIGDTPYAVPGGDNKDNYPLMQPFGENEPPVVEIVNPKKGYFHFYGIPLRSTRFNLIADTMSIGGFKLRPITINVTDDFDESEDLTVKVFLNGEEKGNPSYCYDCKLHEWYWREKTLGTYNLTITAEDSLGEVGSAEMIVWNFCLIS